MDTTEKNFEAGIEASRLRDPLGSDPQGTPALAETLTGVYLSGGYQRRQPGDYDKALCLIPQDVLDFIRATKPREWQKMLTQHGAEAKPIILKRLASEVHKHGALPVLRKVFLAPRQESFAHDLDGNLLADGRWDYVWDGENRLIGMAEHANSPGNSRRALGFDYDWQGRRISKSVSNWVAGAWQFASRTNFLYDGWNLLAEVDGARNLVRAYTWGLDLSGTVEGAGGVGGLVAMADCATGSPATYFVVSDGNGNVTGLVNGADGAVAAVYEYGPFGEGIRASGPASAANPLRFSTKYQDGESGFSYNGFRSYNPATGRWLSRDPIEEEGGENLYGFVGNDPANTIDPFGDDFIAVGGLPVPTTPVLGIGVHMSLRYYKASCDDDPHEGVRFSPGSPPKGSQYQDAVQLWTAWHTYRHYFYVRPKPTAPPERTFVFIPISYIQRSSAATRLLVLYSDADNGTGSSEKGWKKIVAAAASYAYAEQEDANGNPPSTLTHWPNSWYQLLGNNSNTFIRQMAKLINRDPDAIGGGWIAGRRDPEPVSNPGWTPVYAPW